MAKDFAATCAVVEGLMLLIFLVPLYLDVPAGWARRALTGTFLVLGLGFVALGLGVLLSVHPALPAEAKALCVCP